jgi:hypothetical protein
VKHILAAAVAVVALGLVAGCGSDDFGLTAETRSELDANWEAQSSIEQEALCEILKSPEGKLEAFESIEEKLTPEGDGVDTAKEFADFSEEFSDEKEAERKAEAEGMVEYIQAKC